MVVEATKRLHGVMVDLQEMVVEVTERLRGGYRRWGWRRLRRGFVEDLQEMVVEAAEATYERSPSSALGRGI
ncbi:hypothetical protein TIFTF001_034517 [Ficus carica]|uniref:Uncharacterized protein n=1 Tax=Ficus carica TaxID=3494 RepID=A0AA88E1G4_FICCA|nr:hypothetical protein TIFTF001_034516 [Ficus carica]GMN65458.1 hypothetical protein TIFTF001_034517 [Ficus carica]